MKACIATVSLFGELPDKLAAIAAAGFRSIEMFAGDMPTTPEGIRETTARLRDLDLTVELYQPIRDVEGVEADRFRDNLDRAERIFDQMEEIGAPRLLVCSNAGEVVDDDALAADQLRQVAERAAARNLSIGYEALAWGTRTSTWDGAWRIVQMADHPALGIILDSFHVQVRPEDYAGIADIPGDRIAFVQLGDAPKLDLDPMTLRRQHSTIPGRGDMDVEAFMQLIRLTRYDGPLSVELFNLADRTPAQELARDAMAALMQLGAKSAP